MIPHPWVAVVLVLGVYRLMRLVGWDDFPPIAKLRDRIVGMTEERRGTGNAQMGVTDEKVQIVRRYRRPVLKHFIGCGFCVGFWIGVVVYVWWLFLPVACLYALAPFALNGAVGLISKNLDK